MEDLVFIARRENIITMNI